MLTRHGARFSLGEGGASILSGSATLDPYGLELDVGDAEILGFGAATGGPDRNGARFRVMTRDTLLYGIPGSSYTAIPFFIASDGARAIGVLVATTYPLDVVVADGTCRSRPPAIPEGSPLDVIVFRGSARRDRPRPGGARRAQLPAARLGARLPPVALVVPDRDAVLDVARRFRALDLPADVVHLDIHYMDRYRVFTFHPSASRARADAR